MTNFHEVTQSVAENCPNLRELRYHDEHEETGTLDEIADADLVCLSDECPDLAVLEIIENSNREEWDEGPLRCYAGMQYLLEHSKKLSELVIFGV